jgi:hypothetical protein
MIIKHNLRLPLHEKVVNFLRPWSADLDSHSTGQIDSMRKDQANEILMLSAKTDINVAVIYIHINQLNLVESHCQRGLSFARLYEVTEDEKADLLCGALKTFYELRRLERNYTGSSTFAEQVYNCVAVAYISVHPTSTLIDCLTCKGDLCKAELFAQTTFDSLKDPKNGLDQQSEAVAKGYYDLADVIITQRGDLVKAEKLARESLRIRVLITSNNHLVGNATGL